MPRTRTKSRRSPKPNKRPRPKNLPLPKARYPSNAYYAHTMPGLEKLAWQEIEQKLPDATLIDIQTMGRQNGLLIFTVAKNPTRLMDLRTVEDIFAMLVSAERLPRGRMALNSLASLLTERANWPAILKRHRETTGYHPKKGRQTTYRVISRVDGFHPYHRKEAQARVEKAIQKDNMRWVKVADDSLLEIWLNILEQDAVIIGLRLSDQSMRIRPYQVETLPASLRPSVAATMVMLSQPRADDRFLDPMCGAGTIMIERALWGPCRQLLGGDIRPKAITAAQANIDRALPGGPTVTEWDATNLSHLPAGSIDKVACNLPFGKQIGSRRQNETLYRQFAPEMARLLRLGGQMVLLSSQYTLLTETLKAQHVFDIQQIVPLKLLGTKADIFVVSKRG